MMTPKIMGMTPSIASGSMHLTQETITFSLRVTIYPAVGEPHRYVANLSKLFDRFYEFKYFVIITDNDVGDKSGDDTTISNLHITTIPLSHLV